MAGMDMDDDETLDQVIAAYLPERSGNELDDLVQAFLGSKELRRLNSRRGARLIDAMKERLTWEQMKELTQTEVSTLRSWYRQLPDVSQRDTQGE
jgi:hypothetical protein